MKAAGPLLANKVGDIGKEKQDAAERDRTINQNLADEAKRNGDAENASRYQSLADQAKATADSWGDNGVNRLALHAASQGLIGALAGGGAGSLSGVAGVGGGNVGQQLGKSLGEAEAKKQGLTGAEADALVNTYQQALASLGGALGGLAAAGVSGQGGIDALGSVSQGSSSATAVDVFNRQLHATEKERIKQLANGDSTKEAKLTAAACAAVKCYAEYPVDSAVYKQLKQLADIGNSPELSGERQQLVNQRGLFTYTTTGWISDSKIDAAKQMNNTYQIVDRGLGAGQLVLGGLGVAGSLATAPLSCVTGVGCVANALVGTYSADAAYTGARRLVSGNPVDTFLNQSLQGLGMSPQAAGLVETALGIGSAVTANMAVNKVLDQAAALNKLSAASYQDFVPAGLKMTPDILATPQVQALIKEIQAGTPTLSQSAAERFARTYIESGNSLPQTGIATQGSILVKAVPKGDNVSPYSGFWMSPQQARAIATMSPEEAGKVLGLPAAQAGNIQKNGIDFYAITPKPGMTPNVFVSDVAKTSQGAATMPGGAQQVIVPNRAQWTTPVPVNPFILLSKGVH
nr:hypothetical protein [Janthinobacterium agaricidamnosum]